MKKFNFAILLICIFSMIFTNISWASSMRGTLDVYDVDDCMVFYLNGEEFYGSHFVKKGTTYMQLKDLGNGTYIYTISTTNSKHTTPRGLRVGDSYNKMVKLYGKGSIAYVEGNKVVYQFSQGGPGDEIFFDFFVTVDKSTGKVVQYNFGATL